MVKLYALPLLAVSMTLAAPTPYVPIADVLAKLAQLRGPLFVNASTTVVPTERVAPNSTEVPLPLYPKWEIAECEPDLITNAAADPGQRWEAADAQNAFNNFTAAASGNPDTSRRGDLAFVAAFSNYFHGPESWQCDVQHDQCGSGVQSCSDHNDVSTKTLDNPGSWMIMNSFSNLHLFYLNWYTSLGDAGGRVAADIGSFTEVFNPEAPRESDIFANILIEILPLGFGQVASKVVKLGLEKVLKDADKIEKAADTMRTMVSKGTNKALARQPDTESALRAQNTASSVLGKLVDEWQQNIAETTSDLINPSFEDADAIASLGNVISDGRWLRFDGKDLYDMKNILETTLYGLMLPRLWQQKENRYPVIIMEHKDCSEERPGQPSNKDKWDENDDIFRYVHPDTAARSRVCHDGKTFYMLQHNPKDWRMASYCPIAVGAHSSSSCRTAGYQHFLENTPGGNWDELNGQNWGGVTLDDIVQSAYEGYKYNNNQNGYEAPVDSRLANAGGSETTVPLEAGLRTPGMIKLPICTAKEAYIYMQGHNSGSGNERGPNYPCP